MKMRRIGFVSRVAVFAFAAGCADASACSSACSPRSQTSNDAPEPLTLEQLPQVAALVAEFPPQVRCSGIWLESQVVLTAKHCDAAALSVGTGQDGERRPGHDGAGHHGEAADVGEREARQPPVLGRVDGEAPARSGGGRGHGVVGEHDATAFAET